jgi:hypothetical protein
LLATVAGLLLPGSSGRLKLWRGGRGSVLRIRFRWRVESVGDQERLVRIEAFGARAVKAAQEKVESMLKLFVLVPGLPEHVDQLADHLLEYGRIAGQRRARIGKGSARDGIDVRAHALLDARNLQIIRCFFEKSKEISRVQAIRLATGR